MDIAATPHNTSVFEKNIASITIHTPYDITNPFKNTKLAIFPAKKSNAYTATYNGTPLHSIYDPQKEVQQIAKIN